MVPSEVKGAEGKQIDRLLFLGLQRCGKLSENARLPCSCFIVALLRCQLLVVVVFLLPYDLILLSKCVAVPICGCGWMLLVTVTKCIFSK